MDDDSKDSSGYHLDTQSFTLKEVERLVDALGKKFKFEVNIQKAKNKKTILLLSRSIHITKYII